MTGVLSLTERLRSLGDEELTTLIRRRGVEPGGPADFFELAEVLLGRRSIERALRHADRRCLAVLAIAAGPGTPVTRKQVVDALRVNGAEWADDGPALDTALAWALDEALAVAVGDALSCLPPVAEQLHDWPTHGLPGVAELCAAPTPVETGAPREGGDGGEDPDRRDAGVAFDGVGLVADLLLRLQQQSPPAPTHAGRLTASSLRRTADEIGAPAPLARTLFRLAARARLVAAEGAEARVTHAGHEWLREGPALRWSQLAGRWVKGLSGRVRTVLGATSAWGPHAAAHARWLYPAAGSGLVKRLAAAEEEAHSLALAADGRRSPTGGRLFLAGADVAAAALAPHFPSPVTSVYVQDDLTIIAPGPLRNDLDARLRDFCEAEGGRLASSYRVTEQSVTRAAAEGLRAAEILDFLAGISTTGIPQPLEYLVTEAAERYGRIRVTDMVEGRDRPVIASPRGPARTHERRNDPALAAGAAATRGHARSRVSSEDETLLRAVEVDSALRDLALRRDGDILISNQEPVEVLRRLVAARYPAAGEPGRGIATAAWPDDDGHAAEGSEDSAAARLVARLRQAETLAGPELHRAWIGRALEAAAHTRSEVGLEVQMPGGAVRGIRLKLTGFSATRVRGRDVAADVERTLPLSSITAVLP
ncbi:MAG TPA: helicase-associated domain-containing protein [Microbacteriaceae bacterium]|nr:helicase-associated domain-containing protein [Microbacteriaceae bacterium]